MASTSILSLLAIAMLGSVMIHAACPNGLTDSMTQAMMGFAQNQFGKSYTWDCALESQASTNSSQCSTTNAGASGNSLKFSLPLSTGSSGSAVVQSHFQNNQGAKVATRATGTGSIGCGFADCNGRVDIVCMFKN